MMERVESANVTDALPTEKLRSVLHEHPVGFAILFGSRATGDAHRTSDIDIAVEFESIDRESSAYNEVFFGLSADLGDVLGTDDVDLVDVHTLSPAIAEVILEQGVLLVGEQRHAEDLLQRIAAPSDERSPRKRFDAVLGKIDEHLDDSSAVPATDSSRGEP